MGDDLDRLPEALRIGRRTRVIVRRNRALSLAILALLVPGALLGAFSLPVAVVAHEVSEVLVIANGIRAARAWPAQGSGGRPPAPGSLRRKDTQVSECRRRALNLVQPGALAEVPKTA